MLELGSSVIYKGVHVGKIPHLNLSHVTSQLPVLVNGIMKHPTIVARQILFDYNSNNNFCLVFSN